MVIDRRRRVKNVVIVVIDVEKQAGSGQYIPSQ